MTNFDGEEDGFGCPANVGNSVTYTGNLVLDVGYNVSTVGNAVPTLGKEVTIVDGEEEVFVCCAVVVGSLVLAM